MCVLVVGLDLVGDPPSDRNHFVTQTSEDQGEEGIDLETVSASALYDNLVEELARIERDLATVGIVQAKVLERHATYLSTNQFDQEVVLLFLRNKK